MEIKHENVPVNSRDPSTLGNEPILPISNKLAVDLGICSSRTSYSWLASQFQTSQIIVHSNPNWATDIYLTQISQAEAQELLQATENLRAQLTDVESHMTRYFTGLVDHGIRHDDPWQYDIYQDDCPARPTRVKREDQLYAIVRGLFYSEYVGRSGFSEPQHIRYDIKRLIDGIEWLTSFCKEHASINPYLCKCLQSLQRFQNTQAFSDIKSIESSIPHGRNRDTLYRDSTRNYVKDSIDFGTDEHFNAEDLLKIGYADSQLEYNADGKTPKEPTSPAYKLRKLAEKYPEEIAELVNAIERFEYLFTLINAKKIDPDMLNAPQLIAGTNGVYFREIVNPQLAKLSSGNVVANTLELHPTKAALALLGANGCGKTQLLLAVANNTISALKGNPVFAKEAIVSEVNTVVLTLNLSQHSNEASSFQNEIQILAEHIQELQASIKPGTQIMVILDEPFRGTDARDATPLLAGLIKYLQDRGAIVAFSSHFNVLANHQSELKELGINIVPMTMGDQFNLQLGVNGSGGIAAAEKVGLRAEIINTAKDLANQRSTSEIEPLPELAPIDMQNSSSSRKVEPPQWLLSLELVQPTERGSVTHGNAINVFAAHSPLCRNFDDIGPNTEWTYCKMPERFAQSFLVKLYLFPDDETYSKEQELIDFLASNSDIISRIYKSLSALKYIDELMPMTSISTHAISAEAAPILNDLYNGLYRLSSRNLTLKQAISELSDNLQQIAPLFSALGVNVGELIKSEAANKLQEFLDGSPELFVRATNGVTREQIILLSHYTRLCNQYRKEIESFLLNIGVINFYITVAMTCRTQNWAKITESSQEGEIVVRNALNTLLANELGKESVTLNDINLDPNILNYIISGTNGGGKTQFMELVAFTILYGKRFNKIPAESGHISNIPYFDISLGGGSHQTDRSSFQDEVRRIEDILSRLDKAGALKGSVLLIDEPFKGTSEEDAIPLLIGLMRYTETRGVKLIFTTHFSGIYSYLEKFKGESKLTWQPLAVNFFDESERFKVKQGVGKSAGIDVAELNGIPNEIINVARNVKQLLFPDHSL